MSSEPSGSIVSDTGPLLEMATGSGLGAYIKGLIGSNTIRAYTNELNIGELRYVLCRKIGEVQSEKAVNKLVDSGYLTISTFAEFINHAARMKCARSLAFPDCFALSMGESMTIPVLFASHEAELLKEIKKRPFKTTVLFLEDYMSKSQRSH